jgi:O-antigen biosynthesis protein
MRFSRFSLVLEWLTSVLRRPIELDDTGFSWRIERPATGPIGWSTRTLAWRGHIRTTRPRARPVEIFVRRPNRRVYPGTLSSPDAKGAQAFAVDFIGSSGLKFYQLHLRWSDGRESLLGYRLLWCRRRVLHVPPRLVTQPSAPAPEQISLAPATTPVASIIIPVYNQTELTLKCLHAVAQHTTGVDYEVILIDDASTEPASASVNRIEHLRVLRNDTNRGFLHNCNKAAGVARGRHLVFLNNDTEVQPGWLEALLDTYRQRRDTGLVGARLVHPDGRLQEAGSIIWSDGSAANYGKNRHPFEPAFSYIKEVDYCSGACIAIEKDFFWSLGGFDPLYSPAYYEDTDLAFRVRAAGRKVYYQPRSIVVHHEGATAGTDTSVGVKRHQVTNAAKFFARWGETLRRTQRPPGRDRFLARDRSAGRVCIAFIDHKLPHFDRDAGSRSILHYVQLLLEQGANVKFITDQAESDPRYARHLESLGVETIWGPTFSRAAIRRWLREHGAYLDHVILSRPQIAQRFLSNVRRYTRAKVLYFGHDIHFLREQAEAQFVAAPSRQNWQRTRRRELALWSQVDVTYYFTSEETEYVKRTLPGATARTIPLFLHRGGKEPLPAVTADTRDLLFVGGYEHMPNRDAIQWLTTEIMPLVRAQLPEVVLHICGSGFPHELCQAAPPGVQFHVNVSDEQLQQRYRQARVCVVPLRFGAGLKGKVLEALFQGKALVTTPVGAQGLRGIEAFAAVAEDARSFATETVRFYRDSALRETARNASAAFVRERFSPEHALAVLRQDISFSKETHPDSHSIYASIATPPARSAPAAAATE